jgi:TolB protein
MDMHTAAVITLTFVFVPACARDPSSVRNGLIAFPRSDANNHQQIFTITPEGTELRQLTFEGDCSLPSWSPDGTRLVYVSRQANGTATLWVIDGDGSNARELLQGDAPSWGPDGLIAFTRQPSPGGVPEIFVVDPVELVPRQVTSGGVHQARIHPDWSPSGDRLIYAQMTPQDPASDDTSNDCPALPVRPVLWTIAIDGSDPREVTHYGEAHNVDEQGNVINTAYDANAPDWSPVADEIAFWSGQESCYGQVWKARADGSERVQLTQAGLTANDDPQWSPDGTKLLFSTSRNGRPQLWMMNADGSDEHLITDNRPGPGPGDASWQPTY